MGNDQRNAQTDRGGRSSLVLRLIRLLLAPSARYSLLTLLTVGFFGGIIFWGAFNTAMEASNTEAFCIACHEMRDNVYQEYKQTIHYTNRTGVRAICSDCHVPKEWTHKLVRKVNATFELYGKITGSISTPEKFEAKRLTLAQSEWSRMLANDSRECRNCHGYAGMKTDVQKPRAQQMHTDAQAEKKTCIECHKGIAHKMPKMPEKPGQEQDFSVQ